MKKRINKYTILFGSIVCIICLIIECLIQMKFSYYYALTFIIGLFTGLLNLLISDFTLSKLEFNLVSKPKLFFTFSHLGKFIIYAVVMFICAYIFGYLCSISCAIGMLFHKIVIYYLYIIKDPRDDKKRIVDELELNKDIITKLKYNNFLKVIDITLVDRDRLLQFLTLEETEMVIKSLKKYELFMKGELEEIIEDDEIVDV